MRSPSVVLAVDWAGTQKGFFGMTTRSILRNGLEDGVEGGLVSEVRVITEEQQFPGVMQLDQPFQNETLI